MVDDPVALTGKIDRFLLRCKLAGLADQHPVAAIGVAICIEIDRGELAKH